MRIARSAIVVPIVAAVAGSLAAEGPVFLGPTPYTSMANSPINLSQPGHTSHLEDFEDATLDLLGTTFSVGAIHDPSPTTDSVDADDGAIDGSGIGGHSWLVPAGRMLTMMLDEPTLHHHPPKFGFVLTDAAPGATITVAFFGHEKELLGETVVTMGDANNDGATAEDVFVGCVNSDGGVSMVTVVADSGEFEIDHVQMEPHFASIVAFKPIAPYTSLADSPILTSAGIGVDGILVDFEGGAPAVMGATLVVDGLKGPGPNTDSVDGDDGAIDGSGNGGNSALQPVGVTASIEFDDRVLGELPTSFAFAVTDAAPGAQRVFVQVFNFDLAELGLWTYVINGDESGDGKTAEDRLIHLESLGGMRRIEITPLDSAMEIDHIQYKLPNPPTGVAVVEGASPYLSIADSGFTITDPGTDYVVLDFEDGVVTPFGADLTLSYIVPPSPATDSVDGDDGAIDGSGTAGTSGAEVRGTPVVVQFDAEVIGGYPRDFGIVVTDVDTGPALLRLRGFDPLGALTFVRNFTVVGDDTGNGTTAEDTFLGLHADNGLSRVEIVCLSGNMEVDHIQFGLQVPMPVTFLEATPYVSLDDSPFDVQEAGVDFVVLDFENGVTAPFGAELALSYVVPPSAFTDSVDGDDGAIDGNGNFGNSGAELAGVPVALDFNAVLLGALPTQFGAVITDLDPGDHEVKLVAFNADGYPIGSKTFTITGDADGNGGTAEDRFIGLTSTEPIGRVTITAIGTNMELDHIQFDLASPPNGSVADLNDDGAVDGADLGLLLGNWGGTGAGDFNGDGVVDGADLGVLLGEWA